MLHSIAEMETVAVTATDGILGAPKDLYFDDEAWVIRYLVVETGWIPRRCVLISPLSMEKPNWPQKTLPVCLTLQQVNDSPDIDTDEPVSQDHDAVHLRSSNAVMRYEVHATDGHIGHVQDMLVNENWAIEYVIVDTSDWWLGHQVVIAPEDVTHVSWADSSIYVDLTRDTVRHSPLYNPGAMHEPKQVPHRLDEKRASV